jgi:hypothetical protein
MSLDKEWSNDRSINTTYHLQKEGRDWATSRTLNTLDEVVTWIGDGIGATVKEMNIARENIVRSLVMDFDGFGQNSAPQVCHSTLI